MPEISGINVPFVPAQGIGELKRQSTGTNRLGAGISFDEIFRQEVKKLKFSGHAQTRMISREITLSGEEAARLENAVGKAEQKGSSDTLVLFDDKAFIVNVPNRTVITAMERSHMESNVITNIDSAVIA